MPRAIETHSTTTPTTPQPMDLDAELAVMAGVHAALAPLDYEARVRVLAWLARRFEVDTDALRFFNNKRPDGAGLHRHRGHLQRARGGRCSLVSQIKTAPLWLSGHLWRHY
jgi:hypothetical protein